MPEEDASLSEFVPDDDPEDADAGGTTDEKRDDPAPESTGDPDNGDAPDAVDPAVSTADLRPEGAPCEACGATVRRRWRDGGALVCADCKDW